MRKSWFSLCKTTVIFFAAASLFIFHFLGGTRSVSPSERVSKAEIISKIKAAYHRPGFASDRLPENGIASVGPSSYPQTSKSAINVYSAKKYKAADTPVALPQALALPSVQKGKGVSTSLPKASVVAETPVGISKGPSSLRFFVHKLPKRFDAERLIDKHEKCSVFQWSNDLKFLRHVRDGKSTEDPSSADFFLVPFLSKCYFNFEAKYRLDKMERDFNMVVEELEKTDAWNKWPGRHLFIFSSGVGPTLVPSWRKVRGGIFILAEGDRSAGFYDSFRDIVIPGVGKATKGQVSVLDLHRQRRLLATFRGTLVRGHARDEDGKSVYCRSLLRQALLNMAKDRPDVAINDRKYTDDAGTLDKTSYKRELADSKFCIIPRGLTPWTSRLFDAIALDCIPVILSNAIVFPYERSIDYSQFTIKLPESWVGRLWKFLEGIPSAEVFNLQKRVRKAAPLFLGKAPIDAVIAELAKLRAGRVDKSSGTNNGMTTFWAPGRGTFHLTGNEARQVGPSYSAGGKPHPPASELWVPDESFKKIVGNLWHEENCVPCPKCKYGQWFLR